MTALLLFLAQAAGVIVLLAGLCFLLMLSHSLYERYQFASEQTRAQREALAEARLQGWNLGSPPLNERLLLKLSHPLMGGDVCVGRITDHRENPDDEPELYVYSGHHGFPGDRVVGWMRLPGSDSP